MDDLVDHWRRGVMAGRGRSVTAGATYISYSVADQDDSELYGGGKWGYERKYVPGTQCLKSTLIELPPFKQGSYRIFTWSWKVLEIR